MKRVSLVISGIAACVAFGATGASGLVTPTGGDSVVGNGKLPATLGGCVNELTVVAHSDATGGDPGGSLSYDDDVCGKYFIADVFCLRVNGNRASVIAEFVENQANPNNAGVVAFYEDNGPPVAGVSADFQQNQQLTPAALATREAQGCPAPKHPATRLASGNLKIRDGGGIATTARYHRG